MKKSVLLIFTLLALVGTLSTRYYLRSTVAVKTYRKQTKADVTADTLIKPVKYPHTLNTLTTRDVANVETFLFFVGYPRSSHSILASMMDAHPNVIIAHEFNLFEQLEYNRALRTNRTLLYNALYHNSHKQAINGWRSNNHSFQSKGYNLQLNSSWQGHFRHLKVIGDKSGGITARLYRRSPTLFSHLYEQLQRLVAVPLKVIHVVRNPYDLLATRLLYRFSSVKRQKANYTATHPLDNPGNVSQAMHNLAKEARAVADMSKRLGLEMLEIHNVDFVKNSISVMKKVCTFVALECSQEYLEMIARHTFHNLSITRHSLIWSSDARKFIDTEILSFPFFSRYSFDSPF